MLPKGPPKAKAFAGLMANKRSNTNDNLQQKGPQKAINLDFLFSASEALRL